MENDIVNSQIFLGNGIVILQDRINELESVIVNIVGDWVYTLGFYNTERLKSYLEKGERNWSSTGRYPLEELAFYNIKTNATFSLKQDGREVVRFNI